jgi:hypothetical protein
VDLGAGLVDPRTVASMGPGTLEPGEHISLVVAYVYARAGNGGAQGSVAALQQRVDSIRAFAEAIPGMFTLGESEGLPCEAAIVASSPEERSRPSTISLFPNPVTEQLWLRAMDLPSGTPIHIVDASGRVVAQQTSAGLLTPIDVHHLMPGLYMVLIPGKGSAVVGRIVKQ